MFSFRPSSTLTRLKLYNRLRLSPHLTSLPAPISVTSSFTQFQNHLILLLHQFLCNPYSTSSAPNQAAALPGWLHSSEKIDSFYNDSDDYLGIPQISNWARCQKQPCNQAKDEESETVDQVERDADEVSKVMKFRHESADAAAQALNEKCVDIRLSEDFVLKLLSRFGNDYVRAFGVFKWARMQSGYEISANLYNQMVDILGKCKIFDEMWELVHEMNQLSEGFVTLTTMTKVIRRLAKAGEFNEAIDAFMCIEKFGVKRDVEAMNVLLDPLVRGASIETATSIFSKFKNEIQPTLQTYNIFIHGWCKARKIDRAYKVVMEMEKHGVSPDTVTYNTFVEYYCRGKDFQKVDEIINEMRQKGCRPSVTTYTIYVQGLGKSKELNQALQVYERMKMDGIDPDATFYSSLISQFGRSGRLDDALTLYTDMMKQGIAPNLMTYNSLITLYCLHAREGDAISLLLKMKNNLVKPDVMTYEPLLKICCRKKQMKALAFLLNHMFKSDVSPDFGTYTLLVNELCKIEKPVHACMFFEEMVQTGYTPLESTYKSLIKLLEKNEMGMAKEQIGLLYLGENEEVSDSSD
ncbi:hypothetical protein QQ045_007549 [Rhodiola kirilowii]